MTCCSLVLCCGAPPWLLCMTFGGRFNRHLTLTSLLPSLQRAWYFPRKDDTRPDAPKLTKAWAYYEHITLARYFSDSTGNERKQTRAEPGEMDIPTELFNPFTTRESVLNEWGIGVGLYFSTLRVVALILVVVGIINVAGIYYYATSYSGEGGQDGLMFSLVGSAVCTLGEWVVCEDCSPDELEYNRRGESIRSLYRCKWERSISRLEKQVSWCRDTLSWYCW